MLPRLLTASSFCRVIAVDRLKCGELDPFRKQLRLRSASEAANVRATHPEPAQPEIQQHRSCKPEMIPRAAIVSGPCGGIALSARVSSACEYKRAQIWCELQQAFISRARILHTVHVVNLQMSGCAFCEACFVNAVPGLRRHCLRRRQETRGLIHIVPETRHPIGHELAIELAPPVACALPCEVGKH